MTVPFGPDTSLYGQDSPKTEDKERPKKTTAPPAGAVEVRFVDGSTMKLLLRDEKIELDTAYGKLVIPVAEVQRIEFAQRIPEETRKKIAAAIADLGSADFRRRDAATTELFSLKDKALSRAREKRRQQQRRDQTPYRSLDRKDS